MLAAFPFLLLTVLQLLELIYYYYPLGMLPHSVHHALSASKEQISSSLLQRNPLYSSEKGKQGVPRDISELKIDGITVTFKLVIFQQGSKCPQTHPSRISRVLIE